MRTGEDCWARKYPDGDVACQPDRPGSARQVGVGKPTGYATSAAPALRPALNEEQEEVGALTMRQRMEEHRANPVCASCHVGMDPYGFALENFDAIGKWRTTEGQAPIDAAGVLPDGTRFEGPVGLRKMLLKNPEQFVQTVTKNFSPMPWAENSTLTMIRPLKR